MSKAYICVLSLMFSCSCVFSQHIADTSEVFQAKTIALSSFNKRYDSQLPINKGIVFRPIDNTKYDGSTYFGKEQVYKGRVLYLGEWYDNLDLVYDIYSDQLIHVKSSGEWLVLVKSGVERFTLGNNSFINNPDVDHQKPSFYELILPGKAEVLVKHNIRIGNYNFQTLKRDLQNRTRFIVQNLNAYYEIDSKSDLLFAFRNKRSEISAFIKRENVDFENLKEAIKQVVVYYNQIN